MDNINLDTIATVVSPYQEKFAVPRQPGLVKSAQGKIVFNSPFDNNDALKGIEQYTHIWVIFYFHKNRTHNTNKTWKPLIKPPRLGGNKTLGVFASRSPFRPNPIGLSVVKLDGIHKSKTETSLLISELDLVNGTPVLDIKPYIPYADSLPQANTNFATSAPSNNKNISFSTNVDEQLSRLINKYSNLKVLITEILQQDPRPAYKQKNTDDKVYGMALYDLNIRWLVVNENEIKVVSIDQI